DEGVRAVLPRPGHSVDAVCAPGAASVAWRSRKRLVPCSALEATPFFPMGNPPSRARLGFLGPFGAPYLPFVFRCVLARACDRATTGYLPDFQRNYRVSPQFSACNRNALQEGVARLKWLR